jgi:hypothetical protein
MRNSAYDNTTANLEAKKKSRITLTVEKKEVAALSSRQGSFLCSTKQRFK